MKTQEDIDAFLGRIRKRFGEKPGASHSGKHRAAFTVWRPVIEATLAEGFTMMAAWDMLREEKELSMSYETFRSHCRRAGIGQAVQAAAPATHPRPEPPRPAGAPAARPGTSGLSDAAERRFQHSRVPRKKDIYG
jgi:Family of unknown function (DUF5338)